MNSDIDQICGQLAKDGFLKKRLLGISEVDQLRSVFFSSERIFQWRNGAHLTLEMEPIEIKRQVSSALKSIMEERMSAVMPDHRILSATFIAKQPHTSDSVVYPHQDWTFVDETSGSSGKVVWIPLQRTDRSTGTIGFMRGSHLWSDHRRFVPDHVQFSPFPAYNDQIMSALEFIDVELGEVLIWDHRTLHASLGNLGNDYRLAVALNVVPNDVPLEFHYHNPIDRHEVLVYLVADDFFLNNNSSDFRRMFERKEFPTCGTAVRRYDPTEVGMNVDLLPKLKVSRPESARSTGFLQWMREFRWKNL